MRRGATPARITAAASLLAAAALLALMAARVADSRSLSDALRPLRSALFGELAPGAASGPEPNPGARPRNALLISIDTLRADRLGAYGHPRPTSPHLDRLAAEGVLFEEVRSASPWTLPSHASLLTGLYPARHRVRTMHDRLSPDVTTLAERLRREGFATGAVVNVLFLHEGFEVTQGFQHRVTVPWVDGPEGAAPRVVAEALAWLRERREPWLLFVHFFDVHSDYRSWPRFERLFVERRHEEDGRSAQILELLDSGKPVGRARAAYLARLYEAGIRQLDLVLGAFFDMLEAEGHLARTAVVVTSDHGEEFGEHGGVGHSTHHREILRVPLLLRAPGLPAGRRIAAPVSLVDVAPTLLDLLGLPPGEEGEPLDGRSLRPLWEEGGEDSSWWERPLFAEAGPSAEKDTRRSVRAFGHTLLEDREAGRRALYHVAEDPRERHDLIRERPALARRLGALLETLPAPGEQASPTARSPVDDAPLREQLRALGYLDGPASGP